MNYINISNNKKTFPTVGDVALWRVTEMTLSTDIDTEQRDT